MLRARYGAKGKEILNLARLYDKYISWHNTNYMDTPDDSAKEQVALVSAVAGIWCVARSLVLLFEAARPRRVI